MDRWRGFGDLSRQLLEPALAGYLDSRTRGDGAGPAVHDACALACALQPELFTLTPATVRVETSDPATLGRTSMDLAPAAGARALVATDVDVEPLWALMEAAFARVSADVRER
jgi:purine nucleosidase